MNIILAGIIGRYPYGGVTWCSLMYLLGLRELGHNVWYLEDTGECNYDPVANELAVDPAYALNYLRQSLAPFGLQDRWCYIDYTGKHHGHDKRQWLQVCKDADLFLNLSGGSWFWRDEYAAIPHTAFIDSDPAFTQLAIDKGPDWYKEFFAKFGTLFTFGRNIGTPACDVPTGNLHWNHTWQPVTLSQWPFAPAPPRRGFSTVMSWKIESFEDIGGNKGQEFLKVLDMPKRTRLPIELAINGPMEFLQRHGWNCVDGYGVSSDIHRYRDYLSTSRGEFSIAKHTYVSTNSGWFSDRSECYLASGRPAVVQDTGFSAHLPCGRGLVAFHTMEEAAAALEEVEAHYEQHRKAARELAEAHFSPHAVLAPLLETVTNQTARLSTAGG